MPSRVEFDDDGLASLTRQALEARAAEMQTTFDSIHRSHQGKPVDEAKAALQAACDRGEMTPDDVQLQSWAQSISDGIRPVFVVKP